VSVCLPTLQIQQVGDSADPVIEERVLQAPPPGARIENFTNAGLRNWCSKLKS
jgi:hypothetical protein